VFHAPPRVVSNPIYVLAAQYLSCGYLANIFVQIIFIFP